MSGWRTIWRDLRVTLGQALMAVLGQPVAGPTREERENNDAQRAQLRQGRPASAGEAARQVAAEAARVAALQPADRARHDSGHRR